MSPSAPALDVVVRFSSGLQDVVLHITAPATTSTLSLKQLIRNQIPPPASAGRLRLIHAGKALADAAALSRSLGAAIPPPPRDDDSKTAKAKGKQPMRDVKTEIARTYLHCSIGDALSPTELAAEARQADEADAALASQTIAPGSLTTALGDDGAAGVDATTPAPRGFDRLLSTGFTASEVAALRTQFLAIQAHTHTPDAMPSGPELLSLEERWLDNGSNPATGGDAGDAGGFGSDDVGGLEDMLYGSVTGFFWPVGAIFWLMREEGVWSRRRQIAVLSGFLVNLTFGFLQVMN